MRVKGTCIFFIADEQCDMPTYLEIRLAHGVGSGQTTVGHAQSIGALFGSPIFNQQLVLEPVWCFFMLDFTTPYL